MEVKMQSEFVLSKIVGKSVLNLSVLFRGLVLSVLTAMSICAVPANADEGFGALSDTALLEQWWVVQDACRGGYDDYSACEKRDQLTATLTARGYEQHNHDVWTSLSDVQNFNGVVASTNEWAVNQGSFVRAMAATDVLKSLRKYLPDDKIIALWNDSHEIIRDVYPLAWGILRLSMRMVVMDHSKGNDPRYNLAY